jgi:serine/threonine-protein kinase
MSSVSESGLLRLAIAKGVLQWEDLDSIAGHLGTFGDGSGAPAPTPLQGRYVRALITAGFLSRQTAQDLAEELEQSSQDVTPNLLAPLLPNGGASPARNSVRQALPPDFRFLSGWSRYRVHSFVGSGGMGTAYKAYDPHLNRYVALKFLHRNDPLHTSRFLREARAQARVEHANVCQVHEVGEVDGRPYIAMQYIDGRPLNTLRDELSLEAKVRVVRDVAWAVHAAHRTGLIHRDLKPGNVLVGRDEDGAPHPYVVDFGLALDTADESLSTTAILGGTPAYISPEAASGQPLDARSDVYSLGVLLYELLTGAKPFSGLNPANLLVRIAEEDATPVRRLDPTLPQDLETIVQKCMEKDRNQRYASSRDLAEDLSRFLDGDPIQARPATLGYRLRKRLRKNRGMALVSAGAVLALLTLAAANLHAHLQAREQAELARRFGERIGRLEADMRLEAYLPLHPVTARKAELRHELEAIRTEMKRLGRIAEGPGHEALGKGYLALHLYEPALEHLELAWKAGQRTAEVAEALGETGGFLYERALADLGAGVEGKARDRAELERAYRRKTLTVIRQAVALTDGEPGYLQALLAFYDKRYPETVAFARRAYERDPRLFRAAQLEARVYAVQADAAADSGKYAEALRLFDRSGEVYAQILRIAPSEASLHLGDCSRRARRLAVVLLTGEASDGELARAVGACDLALAVDPEVAGAHVEKAAMYWRRADEKRKRGADPTHELALSIDLARSAIRLQPNDGHAFNSLAVSHRLLAAWQLDHGQDPNATIAGGLAAARRAVALQPGLAAAHNTLATALLVQVQSELRRGADPRPALVAAVRSCERASQLDPRYLLAHINLGTAWKTLAEAEMARGANPSTALAKSAAAFDRAIRLNPNRATTYNNLGNAYLTLGEFQVARGADPRLALAKAAASYRHAAELKPDYAYAHYNLASTQRSLAQALLDRGTDPRSGLAAAEAALDRAQALNPGDTDTLLESARVGLLTARWLRGQSRSPQAAFQNAERSLARAETLNPKEPEVYFEAARLARYRGEASPAQASPLIARGLVAIDKAVAINAGEARYLALRGVLQTLAAEGSKAGAARTDWLRKATASFEEALRRNPLLGAELATWRERAQGTVNTPIFSRTSKKASTSLSGTGP